ncbi:MULTISPECIES: transglutaminase-like cysteine peptidase [unclassified Sulfuricurvum]|uniref:transglutaminase-like cysteine peptidase n=1 Tax=unclassified Sulfuricurvum TaxID=2632390 RepID=UPI0002999862|nr:MULTISPECIES: transglutaminase-like cysteine peptidase [unclassified Sulfuricurvum]AFV97789.1 periplasmic protein [Candidatus Sulfuricurvum sp. RIFRC-1]OHD84190.1 MAG: transglutaminase [Sulfuricurvum sp. RIFCSPHIGHO2_12_FULL_44_8]OHD86489.1 MAG: transglutaminase [Sulfuricurvum sp. RIFCSPLOWO2_02_FULL_43_45]HBM36407.1 transglutaminase [Sulfuricurvum sp.]
MKKTVALFFITAALAAILLSSPEFSISKAFMDKIEREYGPIAKKRAFYLIQMMNEARDLDDMGKMEKVNDFFNQTPYASDKTTWGISDYWATRYEFIGKDRADCEDYVIAKYFTLKELGVPTSKLFMTYAKSIRYKSAHLVLTYYETPKSIPLVLDNYNFKILPASVRDDLIPIYSFSGDELFNAKQAQIGKMVPAATKQKRPWDELVITR